MSELVLAPRVAEERDVVRARQQARRVASLRGLQGQDQFVDCRALSVCLQLTCDDAFEPTTAHCPGAGLADEPCCI